jgi:hypothetical protein
MSMEADPDFDPQTLADEGFIAAKMGENFLEHEMEGWVPARIFAAQSMGMLYPMLDDAAFEQMERTAVYAGALKDVVIFLWLRVRQAGESAQGCLARAMRAQRKPQEAWMQAQAWAEEMDLLNMSGERFLAGYNLFTGQMAHIQASKGEPVVEGGKAMAGAGEAQKKSDPGVLGGLRDDGGGGEQA